MRVPPPVAELLSIDLVSAGEGECTMKLEAGEQHSNPMGTIHGGILCDVADAAMGWPSTPPWGTASRSRRSS